MKGKMLFVFLLFIAVLIALVGRLAYIQLKSGDRYARIILNQQEYSSKTIPFRRGDIVDRKGTVLATSTDVYNVILDCSVLTSREQYLEPTIAAMVQCFGVDETELRAYVSEIRKSVIIKSWTSCLTKKSRSLRIYKMTKKMGKYQGCVV